MDPYDYERARRNRAEALKRRREREEDMALLSEIEAEQMLSPHEVERRERARLWRERQAARSDGEQAWDRLDLGVTASMPPWLQSYIRNPARRLTNPQRYAYGVHMVGNGYSPVQIMQGFHALYPSASESTAMEMMTIIDRLTGGDRGRPRPYSYYDMVLQRQQRPWG
jgi:hypothetical protein